MFIQCKNARVKVISLNNNNNLVTIKQFQKVTKKLINTKLGVSYFTETTDYTTDFRNIISILIINFQKHIVMLKCFILFTQLKLRFL